MATIVESFDALATVGTDYDIVFGDEFLGEIGSSRERDWVRTELDVGYSYWAQIRGDGTATQLTDNSLRIRDEVGTSLSSGSGSGPIVSATPTELATYYLDAGGQFSSTLGTYRITLNREVANSVATVSTLDVGANLTSAVDYAGDLDYFRVQLESGIGYYARMTGDGGAGQITDNRLRLLDDVGTSVQSVSGDTPLVEISPVEAGTYYLQTGGQFTSRTGTYALELLAEVAEGAGTSSVIGYGQGVAPTISTIDYAADSDWYGITLANGYSYLATVNGDGSGNTLEDARVRWRDEAGSQISSDSGEVAFTWVTPTENGKYFVEAAGQFSSDTGGYEITVQQEISNAFDTKATLKPGQTFSSTLEYNADQDVIRTSLSGGVEYAISLGGAETGNPISRAYLQVFNSNDVQIGNQPFSQTGALEISFTPTTTGTYFLQVGDDSGVIGRAGDYDLLVTKTPVSGDDAANIMIGDAEPDVLNGLGGRDFITGEGGADHLNGGDNADSLFGDQFEVAYYDNTASFMYRLYQSAFGRVADQEGHQGWVERIVRGEVRQLATTNSFVQSAEFQQTYGQLDNRAFVELLYQNVFGREADEGGLHLWLTGLNSQSNSRAEVLERFTNSIELRNAKDGETKLFLRDTNPAEWADDVFRLYRATLDRDPDQAGLLGWSELLSTGTSFNSVISGFTNSPEFRQTYGDLDDASFVELLYQNVLDRASDSAGREGWLDVLDGGGSRAQVVRGFSQSVEFIADTEAQFIEWMRAQGTDDVLDGGDFVNGVDHLAGGILSDEFIIRPNTHTTVILDLEAWDTLDFGTFGYTDKEQVLDNILSSSEIAAASGEYWSDTYDNYLNFRDPNGNTFVELRGVYEGDITLDMILT